jgi:hypothetical protein
MEMEMDMDMDMDLVSVIDKLRSYKKNKMDGMARLKDFFVSIANCRDIYNGMGQRDLSYRMIYDLYQVFPVLAIKALYLTVGTVVGSWCDVKYFCLFIEKISPDGFYDPLIEVVIRIANRQLKLDLAVEDGGVISNVAKWIPRECHHPELFGLFVRDWFQLSNNECWSGHKKSYRKMIVGLCSRISLDGYKIKFSKIISKKPLLMNFSGIFSMPSLPIGEYVRAVLEGADSVWINYEWRKLMRTVGFTGKKGIAVVDLDSGIRLRDLYDALGFACLISEKMGIGRILLGGSVPICVDVSVCLNFDEKVRLLWGYCEMRGEGSMNSVMKVLKRGEWMVPDLRVFVFSKSFEMGVQDSGIEYIFWKFSGSYNFEGNGNYMLGSCSGAIKKFLYSGSQQEWMLNTYFEWFEYFERFSMNVIVE